MKIYTKTGDKGETSLLGGKRVHKDNIRIEGYGTVDELNSFIGLARDHLADEYHRETLKNIQNRLFTIGAALAADPDKPKLKKPDLKQQDISMLENEIDLMNEELPPLEYFILPGGHPAVSYLHVSRCICRRAERMVVGLYQEDPIDDLVLVYLNRLSDYLFVLARMTGKQMGAEEIHWKPRK